MATHSGGIIKFWKLLPTAALVAGVLAVVPAAAWASTSAGPKPPPGVTVGGPVEYAPNIHPPKTPHLPIKESIPPSLATVLPKNTLVSGNWAGYVDIAHSGKTFTYAGTTFTIPKQSAAQKAQCVEAAKEDPIGESWASYWVGLSGWNNSTVDNTTVQQDGVDTYCESNGVTGTLAWYEMYPLNPVAFTGTNPGDKIVVTVTYASGKYDLYLHDTTNGGHFNVVASCPSGSTCARTSDEVITEDPGGGPAGGVYLANYSSAGYTGASVKGSGVTGNLRGSSAWSGSNKIDEEYNGVIMQTTGNLNNAGTAFFDTFNHPF